MPTSERQSQYGQRRLNKRGKENPEQSRRKTYYWDAVQVVQERPKEMLKAMTKSRARSVLGVGLKGESSESITWGSVYRSFRRECSQLELGGDNEKGTTLRDCHEAYQILIKDAKPCMLKRSLSLYIPDSLSDGEGEET